jgi:exportin-T
MLLQHLSLVLAFLADEYDDPTECVISGVNATLGYYKKLKKKATPGGSLQQTHLEALTRLTEVALQKMKYDDEAEWTGAGTRVDRDGDGGISDDDEAVFVELRKQLQQILAAVASIDESIFTTRVQNLIMETLNAAEQSLQGNGPTLTWQQAEVAVFAAYFFVEVLINAPGQTKSGVSVNTFVELPPEHQRTSTAVATKSSKLSFSVYPTLPLNALGRTIQAVAQSSISQFPHPAVQLQYFECLNRYSAFFVTRPDNLSTALFAFLDRRGIYNSHQGVRHRVWYLFSRFVKEVAVVVPGDYVAKVSQSLRVSTAMDERVYRAVTDQTPLSLLQDVLVVNADLPQASADEDPLRKATETAGLFDSQLYLFESVGCLISTLRSNPQQVVELLRAASEPLVVQLDNAVQAFSNKGGDLREVLQAHHLILALSTLSQGFPDLGNGTLTATDEGWVEVFKSMTERVLLALNALNRFSIIREASRGAFSRIIATTGRAVLPLIPNLIQGLLGEITAPELVDFLSFLGLLVSKFKVREESTDERYKTVMLTCRSSSLYQNEIRPMLDELLLVLLDRIFHFLNQEVTGTDDAVQKTDLQRAYVAFLAILLNAGLDSIFLSDRNKDQLQTILQSVVYYASNGDPLCQKACFNILNRLVTLWGSPAAVSANGNGTNGVTSANVPGFEGFIYETLVPLTFEVPAKASFDFGDAQAQQVSIQCGDYFSIDLQSLTISPFASFSFSSLLPGSNRNRQPPQTNQPKT